MLFHLLYPLHSSGTALGVFNVFKYITFRTFGASITAVLLCMLIGPSYIAFYSKTNGQAIRDDGPKSHLAKGTPMGGGLMLLGITIATLLWADLNKHIWVALLTTLGCRCDWLCRRLQESCSKNSRASLLRK